MDCRRNCHCQEWPVYEVLCAFNNVAVENLFANVLAEDEVVGFVMANQYLELQFLRFVERLLEPWICHQLECSSKF